MEYRLFTNCRWVENLDVPQYGLGSHTKVLCGLPGPEYAEQVMLLHAAASHTHMFGDEELVAIIKGVGEYRRTPHSASYWFPPKGESDAAM